MLSTRSAVSAVCDSIDAMLSSISSMSCSAVPFSSRNSSRASVYARRSATSVCRRSMRASFLPSLTSSNASLSSSMSAAEASCSLISAASAVTRLLPSPRLPAAAAVPGPASLGSTRSSVSAPASPSSCSRWSSVSRPGTSPSPESNLLTISSSDFGTTSELSGASLSLESVGSTDSSLGSVRNFPTFSVPVARIPYTVVYSAPGSSSASKRIASSSIVQDSLPYSGWKPRSSTATLSGTASLSVTVTASCRVDVNSNAIAGTGNSSASNRLRTVTPSEETLTSSCSCELLIVQCYPIDGNKAEYWLLSASRSQGHA